jgi:ferrous iron transport protein B
MNTPVISPSSASASPAPAAIGSWRVALVGNPNAGKTTLFNALTGLRHKVANYPGVTVEKKEGRCRLAEGENATIVDLPGTYSLAPSSPDEAITRNVLLGGRESEREGAGVDAVLVVVDASNLERNLYLATQVLELGLPCVVALNMADVARAQNKHIDLGELERELGAPVRECVAIRSQGLDEIRAELARVARVGHGRALEIVLPLPVEEIRQELAAEIEAESDPDEGGEATAEALALRLLADNEEWALGKYLPRPLPAPIEDKVAALRERARLSEIDVAAEEARARHELARGISHRVSSVLNPVPPTPEGTAAVETRSFSDRADAILLHPWSGLAIFAAITLLVFQAIFSWSSVPVGWLESLQEIASKRAQSALPPGPLADLLVNGVIAGVGAVVVFVPQIAVLFFFIGILEDTGYMARAALLTDRLMARVGLHGRAFIPLVSSFACAIPGVMATRTIASPRDRLATILIAPLMTCSARLPVYALMIGAFIPDVKAGPFGLRALTMFGLYAAGVVFALLVAWIFKRTILKGPPPALILELPAYKMPSWRNIVVTMWERSSQFVIRAGTVILSLSILLWFLLSYPKLGDSPETARLSEEQKSALQVERSFAGRLGHAVEPVIAPLGFNWKIGIGLIGAMSAREVFNSTLGTVYSVSYADEEPAPLTEQMKRDRWPDGRPVWTTLVAVSLLMYFVIAMQCISTLAVVRRETNSWKWPIFMLGYMTMLAWAVSFAVYQGGRALGWG